MTKAYKSYLCPFSTRLILWRFVQFGARMSPKDPPRPRAQGLYTHWAELPSCAWRMNFAVGRLAAPGEQFQHCWSVCNAASRNHQRNHQKKYPKYPKIAPSAFCQSTFAGMSFGSASLHRALLLGHSKLPPSKPLRSSSIQDRVHLTNGAGVNTFVFPSGYAATSNQGYVYKYIICIV